MKAITAAVIHSPLKPFVLETLHIDEPRADEVLVRVVATGICHTDLVFRAAGVPTAPVVLGHEGAGVVERVGSAVTKVKPGDHVVLTYASCGECPNCRRARESYCTKFVELNLSGTRADRSTALSTQHGEPVQGSFFGQSSFANYAMAKQRNVVKVPEDVPLELLGPLGCGIQTGAGTVMNVLKPAAGSSIAIFGAGTVGLAAVMAARIVGCTRIIAIDIKSERLDLARELGATDCIDGRQTDAVAAIRALTGDGVQFSLECTGSPMILRQAVEALRPTGECGYVGTPAPGVQVELDMRTLLMGRTLRGVIEGDSIPDLFIPELIQLWRQGRFPFERLYSFFDLAQINQAIEAAESGEVLKPILRMPHPA
ncbi:NAD(P)-dependent alcohol dehydrogenase [Pseudomonas azerbaijanorientalis]|uniref:NAD(P)-dependent alcohol dehydrogenase n=2 Tax=Pseudomonas TaxID=286 RepID=A0ABW8W2T1_9PSED